MFITLLNGFALAGLLFCLASGFSLIFGMMKIVNLAHGSIFLIGSYVGFAVTQSKFLSGSVLNFGLAVLTATAVGALVGLALMAILKPLLSRGFFDQALVTLGIGLLVAFALKQLFGSGTNTIALPEAWSGSVNLFDSDYPLYNMGLIVAGLAVAAATYFVIERTKLGALIRATVSDRGMVRAMGISANKITYITFACGTGLAAFAGAISSPFFATAPGVDNQVLLQALAVVVIGGLGSIRGAAVGALLVGQVQSIGMLLGSEIAPYLLSALMLVVLAVRRQGLFGSSAVEVNVDQPSGTVALPWARKANRISVFTGTGIFIALAAAPFLLSNNGVLRLSDIIAFGLLAVSLDMMVGVAGMGTFGHAAFFGVGTYVALRVGLDLTDNVFVQLGLAAAGAAAVAALVGWIAVRSRAVYFVMITLAIGQLLQQFTANAKSVTGGSDGLVGKSPVIPGAELLSGIPQVVVTYWYVLAAAAALFILILRYSSSPFSRTMRGFRDNETRMSALGYGYFSFNYVHFIICAAFAGAAGSLFVAQTPFSSPENLGFSTMVYVLIAVILGGTGSLWGALIGAAVVMYVNSVLGSQLQGSVQLVLGLTFVALVYLLPGGFASLKPKLRTAFRKTNSGPTMALSANAAQHKYKEPVT